MTGFRFHDHQDFYHPPPPPQAEALIQQQYQHQTPSQYISAVDHFSGSSYLSWSPYFGKDYIAKALFSDFETFFDNFDSQSFRTLREINEKDIK